MEEEEDDRWSNFRDHGLKFQKGTKVQFDPEPELTDYLKVVLAQKSPRERQERKYKVCAKISLVLTKYVFRYMRSARAQIPVRTCKIHASEHSFIHLCLVDSCTSSVWTGSFPVLGMSVYF